MSFSRKRSFRSFFFIGTELFVLVLLCLCLFMKRTDRQAGIFQTSGDFIKWVDFNVTCEALEQAFRYDVDTCQAEVHLNWVDLLAYLGTRYGGDFSRYKKSDMKKVAEQLINGEMTMEELTSDMKYYDYYRQAYGAVLDGMVGTFQAEIPADEVPEMLQQSAQNTDTVWVTKYGLKAFFPLAKNFPYNDFDDFGVSRSYGFKRRHLGHDMMGQVGTPIIAVESGYVEALGWNQYGGWRIGIRSFDKKRYYYYAHLRKTTPPVQFKKKAALSRPVMSSDIWGAPATVPKKIPTMSKSPTFTSAWNWSLTSHRKKVTMRSGSTATNWSNSCRNQCEAVKVEGTKEWRRVYQTKDVPTA